MPQACDLFCAIGKVASRWFRAVQSGPEWFRIVQGVPSMSLGPFRPTIPLAMSTDRAHELCFVICAKVRDSRGNHVFALICLSRLLHLHVCSWTLPVDAMCHAVRSEGPERALEERKLQNRVLGVFPSLERSGFASEIPLHTLPAVSHFPPAGFVFRRS